MIQPYYESGGITIYHGDCLDVLPTLEAVDHVITDPPYNAETHAGARAGNRRTERETNRPLGIDFDHIDVEALRALFAACRPKRWVIATMAYQHVVGLEQNPPQGIDFVRFGVWRKPDSTPQFSGDRPGMGWEAVGILHAVGKKRWNNGGHHAFWEHGIAGKGADHFHPTEKPIGLLHELIEQFTDPGDLILDPFMGSGTTLRAAKNLGRRAIGIEINERYCAVAVERLRQAVLL